MRTLLLALTLIACDQSTQLLENSEKAAETKKTMREIDAAITMYRTRHKRTPRSIDAAFPGRKTPVDGWGRPFVYERPGPGTRKWDVISLGADGEPDGFGLDADLRSSDL